MANNKKNYQGWVAIWRKITKSEIWEADPWRLKAWIHLIAKAEHREKQEFGRKLKRGEAYINRLEDFCKEISWKKGCISVKPPVNAMKKFLWWLRKRGMVETRRTTRGIIIFILNYNKYQDIRTTVGTEKKTLVGTAVDTKSEPSGSPDRQPLKQLNNIASKRRTISFKNEDYSLLLKAYQELKGICLQGEEFKPVRQSIKTMFLSGRTPEQIISCMEWLASLKEKWAESWTIGTVQKKLPEFVAGKFTKDDSWKYGN